MSARALAAAALGAACLAPRAADAQADPSRSLAPTRVGAQVALGAVATPVGFVGGGKLTEIVAERVFGVEEPRSSTVALVGGWVGAALATGGSAALVGARGPGNGSYPAAVGGAVAGGLVSLGIVRLLDRDGEDRRHPCRVTCVVGAVATFTMPSIGATVAYGASRR